MQYSRASRNLRSCTQLAPTHLPNTPTSEPPLSEKYRSSGKEELSTQNVCGMTWLPCLRTSLQSSSFSASSRTQNLRHTLRHPLRRLHSLPCHSAATPLSVTLSLVALHSVNLSLVTLHSVALGHMFPLRTHAKHSSGNNAKIFFLKLGPSGAGLQTVLGAGDQC